MENVLFEDAHTISSTFIGHVGYNDNTDNDERYEIVNSKGNTVKFMNLVWEFDEIVSYSIRTLENKCFPKPVTFEDLEYAKEIVDQMNQVTTNTYFVQVAS